MIRKYNKVFITGDLHLGDITFEQEAKLVEKLKQDKFDLVVFGGDTFDTWRKSLPEILSRYDQLFKFLQRMKSKVVFIRGNHDMEIDYLKKLGFGVRKNLKYTTPGGKKIKIIHGHEFDKDCARWEFITRKAVFVEEKLNRLLKKFDNEAWIRMARLMGNVDMARLVENIQKKIIHYRGVDALVFGHSHLPLIGKKNQMEYYNWGGWQQDLGLKPGYIVGSGENLNMEQI